MKMLFAHPDILVAFQAPVGHVAAAATTWVSVRRSTAGPSAALAEDTRLSAAETDAWASVIPVQVSAKTHAERAAIATRDRLVDATRIPPFDADR
ncbi:hypothetical protein [Actinoallomurus acanthiterrae]